MNSADPTGCFARLGLTPDADARAIKRAYAKELKRIDTHTEPERFARLRQDYEQALTMAADAQRQPEGASEPMEEAGELAGPVPESPIEPQPEAEAQPSQGLVSNDELLARLERLATFTPVDVPAALMILRGILDTEELTSLTRRDAFETALVHALHVRRFGACNGALLLAADEVFGWRVDGARHLAHMGLPGAIMTGVLDEISQTSKARLERMLALAGEPTPARALKLWKPAQPINPHTPLAAVLFPPGHLDRWIEAHVSAPLAGRAKLAFHRLMRSVTTWRVVLAVLVLPVAIGIFSVVSGRVGEEQVREASMECQRAFAAASEARWKNMTLSAVAIAQQCAVQVPPERCVDREALLTVAALADRLIPSASTEASLLSYRFMSYRTIRLNLDDGRLFGVSEGGDCDGTESFLSNADWLGQGDEPAAKQLIEQAARCADGRSSQQRNPALYTFLRHTDAWPATDGGTQKVRYRLRDLLGSPGPVDTTRARVKLQSRRTWGACRAD